MEDTAVITKGINFEAVQIQLFECIDRFTANTGERPVVIVTRYLIFLDVLRTVPLAELNGIPMRTLWFVPETTIYCLDTQQYCDVLQMQYEKEREVEMYAPRH